MVDSMIAGNPESEDLLQIGSQAFVGYVNALEQCGASRERLTTNSDKAKLYGTKLLEQVMAYKSAPKDIDKNLASLSKSDVPDLFWGTLGLLTWIQQQQGSPAAMADLITVEKNMTRILELDETYQAGSAHLFFGGYYAIKPAALGGSPEKARYHFEKALEMADRNFLLTQVTYARTYARVMFDQELHDRLLLEVLNYPENTAPEYGLSNHIAKEKAQQLLDEEYFY